MKQTVQKVFLAFMLVVLQMTHADSQDVDTLSSIDRIVSQIEGMYPRIEGFVVSLESDDVLLDLKEGDPIKPGDTLKLVRYGEEILHPVTQKKLGRKETELGEVEVIQIGKNFTRARATNKAVKAQIGDGVQPAFQKITFLIAPLEAKKEMNIDANRLILSLEKRLKSHQRFDVPPFDLGVWMLESGIGIDQLLQQKNLDRLREKAKADFILLPSVREVKGKMALSYDLASAENGKIKNKAEVLSDSMPTIPKAEPRATASKKDKEPTGQSKSGLEFIGKQDFPFEVVDFDIGDLDGDGTKEFVFIDPKNVRIYKNENSKFKAISKVATGKDSQRYLSVDVGDINGNGRDEIFVTSRYGDNALKSFALEANAKEKRFDKIWDNVNMYLRIIRPFGAKPKLLAQKPGFDGPYSAGIKTIQHQGDKFVEGSDLALPSVTGMNFTLYGLTQATLSSSKTNITIALDNDYHLRVYSPSGRLLEKSDEYYGHDPRPMDLGIRSDLIENRLKELFYYKGRLQLVLRGDKRFVFVPKNFRLGGNILSKAIYVNDCSLEVLQVNEEGLERIGELKKQRGYIAAYQIDGSMIYMAAVQKDNLSGKVFSTLYIYKWNDLDK